MAGELITKSSELMKARNIMKQNPKPQNIDSFLLTFVRFVNYVKRSEYSELLTQHESFLRNDIVHSDSIINMNSVTMRRIIECVEAISNRVVKLITR